MQMDVDVVDVDVSSNWNFEGPAKIRQEKLANLTNTFIKCREFCFEKINGKDELLVHTYWNQHSFEGVPINNYYPSWVHISDLLHNQKPFESPAISQSNDCHELFSDLRELKINIAEKSLPLWSGVYECIKQECRDKDKHQIISKLKPIISEQRELLALKLKAEGVSNCWDSYNDVVKKNTLHIIVYEFVHSFRLNRDIIFDLQATKLSAKI
ncbi:hypothetical protein BpHYR1_030515 [Brachionus plicatilis]|uniref:Uncharacterized protein n=1 Tax=Brachionus plicatilis TaxID=10195 RepID=A0A3M7QXS7_BRAPC|nr:hypothetical protein BpHYR1_030515 [Brachionus plicatilis]